MKRRLLASFQPWRLFWRVRHDWLAYVCLPFFAFFSLLFILYPEIVEEEPLDEIPKKLP